MNKQNQNDSVKKIEEIVAALIVKYAKRKDIFEPLTKTIGDYPNNTFLRAVRNVMFKRIPVHLDNKQKYLWIIDQGNNRPMKTGTDYIQWIAKRIIDEEISLRKLIWRKNDWGDPYPPRKPINFGDGSSIHEGFENFKARCENKMAEYVVDVDKRNELLHSIYAYAVYVHKNAYETGINDGGAVLKRTLIDVHNNIEYNLKIMDDLLNEQSNL